MRVAVRAGVRVNVREGVRVRVLVSVREGVGLDVRVRVRVGVRVKVLVGVRVRVRLGLGVGVWLGLGLGVREGVREGVRVAVRVGVAVGWSNAPTTVRVGEIEFVSARVSALNPTTSIKLMVMAASTLIFRLIFIFPPQPQVIRLSLATLFYSLKPWLFYHSPIQK